MVTSRIGEDAYNHLNQYVKFPYMCISKLLEGDEQIWKLIAYNSRDAWNMPNLEYGDKAALIYSGEELIGDHRVFMDTKQPDATTTETTWLRISTHHVTPDNRTIARVQISMEVFVHFKINHLSNYTTRIDSIVHELFKTFNGTDIGGIGLLFMDAMGDTSTRLFNAGQIPFAGKQLIFSVWSI